MNGNKLMFISNDNIETLKLTGMIKNREISFYPDKNAYVLFFSFAESDADEWKLKPFTIRYEPYYFSSEQVIRSYCIDKGFTEVEF